MPIKKEDIFEALDNATKENGYSFDGMTSKQIAQDLMDFQAWPDDVELAGIENFEAEIIEFVKEWQAKQ